MSTQTERNTQIDVLAVRNPFRDARRRAAFDNMVRAYWSKSKLLFLPGMQPHRGNSWAGMFWRGYEGSQIGRWDAESKATEAYPVWAAGRAVAAALAACAK